MPSYVVTGASRGIGLEYVRQLSAAPGNIVFALVRDYAAAQAVPSSPLKSGLTNVHIFEADVTDHKALKTVAKKISDLTGGSLDVLINNAATAHGENDWRSLIEFDGEEDLLEEEFNHAMKVNVLGVIHSTNCFLPLLRKGNMKKVITISSTAGDRNVILKSGVAQMAIYGASKAAVDMIVAKYAVKLQTEGIIIISLCPGVVDTTTTAAAKQSEKNSEWIAEFIDNVVKSYPHGVMTPEVSVKKQLDVIARTTLKENGGFFSVYGED